MAEGMRLARLLALLLLSGPQLAGAKDKAKAVIVGEQAKLDSEVADMVWMGQTKDVILLQTAQGRLHRSANYGGTWVDITGNLTQLMPSSLSSVLAKAGLGRAVARIHQSPSNPDVVVVQGAFAIHFISSDAGASWELMRHAGSIQSFLWHRTRPDWALLSRWTDLGKGPRSHDLFQTTDRGKTFRRISANIVQFSWGDPINGHDDRVYYTRWRPEKVKAMKGGEQTRLSRWRKGIDLVYEDSKGSKRRTVTCVEDGNKFQVSHGYILVVRIRNEATQDVELQVSADGGDTFNAARLPSQLKLFAFTLLDASEKALILHVNRNAKLGDVYVSDRQGLNFSLALTGNVRSMGICGFEKVKNLRGIYIANVAVDEKAFGLGAAASHEMDVEGSSGGTQADQSDRAVAIRYLKADNPEQGQVRTVISFNKGATWNYIPAPAAEVGSTGCQADSCWLHLHDLTEMSRFAPVYSYRNAYGILMASGNVGAHLSRDEKGPVKTYFSRDAGLTWVAARDGNYIYEFGNHGGLMVMVDYSQRTKEVLFSWDEGATWSSREFTATPMKVTNVIIEPDARSSKFVLYGLNGNAQGLVHLLNFSGIHERRCKGESLADTKDSDYETWIPSDGSQRKRCLMGFQVAYVRKKPLLECSLAEDFTRRSNPHPCECTASDYECNTGFHRDLGQSLCVQEPVFYAPEWAAGACASGDHYSFEAYRRVPDNMCRGGFHPEKVAIPCPGSQAAAEAQSPGASGSGMLSLLLVFGAIGAALLLLRSGWVKDLLDSRNSGYHHYPQMHDVRRVQPRMDAEMQGGYRPPS